MSIFCEQSLLCYQQTVVGGTTFTSENTYDFGRVDAPWQKGDKVTVDNSRDNDAPFLIQAAEAFAGSGNATFILEESADELFQVTNAVFSYTVPISNVVLGYRVPIRSLPPTVKARYLRLKINFDNAPTAGLVTAGWALGVEETFPVNGVL